MEMGFERNWQNLLNPESVLTNYLFTKFWITMGLQIQPKLCLKYKTNLSHLLAWNKKLNSNLYLPVDIPKNKLTWNICGTWDFKFQVWLKSWDFASPYGKIK